MESLADERLPCGVALVPHDERDMLEARVAGASNLHGTTGGLEKLGEHELLLPQHEGDLPSAGGLNADELLATSPSRSRTLMPNDDTAAGAAGAGALSLEERPDAPRAPKALA